jgi:hypothetical protein
LPSKADPACDRRKAAIAEWPCDRSDNLQPNKIGCVARNIWNFQAALLSGGIDGRISQDQRLLEDYQHISISAYQHGSNYFPMVDGRKRSTGIGIFPFRPFKAVVLEKAANYECTEDVQTKLAQASWSRVLCLHCILCSRALFKFNPPRLQKASYVKAGSSLIAHAY